ncbi:hypothetical protein GTW25_02705 [Aliihoeflea aestuarii]|uniref:hypothetical protein n=1 Tax=Aliihoeflea aestuarii TaxID=453840 RepID=UPI002093CF96|nr:hypothetical protein [Aliihoeflea aestuarii]MCO6389938.1 hypothetical protein [Aliihoeflea aestuarii]
MRNYEFQVGGTTWTVNEGPDLRVNGHQVTEWEVRKHCADEFGHPYMHKHRNTYIPRRATIAQIKAHIADNYAGQEEAA